MITFFFTDGPVADYASAKRCGTRRCGEFFRWVLERGFYFPPSQDGDIQRMAGAVRQFQAERARGLR